MVNLACQLNCVTRCPGICLKIILEVSEIMILDEINVWITLLSKIVCSPQYGLYLICWRPKQSKQGYVRENLLALPISDLRHQYSFAFGHRLELTPSALLGLQLFDRRSCGIAPAHHVRQFLAINPHICM